MNERGSSEDAARGRAAAVPQGYRPLLHVVEWLASAIDSKIMAAAKSPEVVEAEGVLNLHRWIQPSCTEFGGKLLARQMEVPAPTADDVTHARDVVSEWTTIETRQQQVLVDARGRLRGALRDGKLQAVAMHRDGRIVALSRAHWLTPAGDRALVTGECDGTVLVAETDAEHWFGRETLALLGLGDGDTGAGTRSQAAVRRPLYSMEALRAWFILRIEKWPKDARPPTEEDDLAAARMHFEGTIPRDTFREIRRAKVPESWRKPGPRRPR